MRKLWKWLSILFNSTKAFVEKYAKPSVETVQNIKAFIDSPVADIITALIPGQLDDLTKNMLRQALPIVLQEFVLVEDCQGCTLEEIAQKALAEIAKLGKMDKQKAYTDIAAKLADLMAEDHKLDWGELSALIVYTYKEFFANAA